MSKRAVQFSSPRYHIKHLLKRGLKDETTEGIELCRPNSQTTQQRERSRDCLRLQACADSKEDMTFGGARDERRVDRRI